MCGSIGCLLVLTLVACAEARSPAAPEPADSQPMQQMMSRSSRDLHVEHMAHGVRKISLQGRFRHVAVVERVADGVAQRACLDRPPAGF